MPDIVQLYHPLHNSILGDQSDKDNQDSEKI